MPNSSLAHYLALAIDHFGTPDSAYYLDENGLRTDALCEALQQAQDSGQPFALLGASYSFVHLMDALQARGQTFQLPAGSRLLDTGGFKGQSREVPMDAFYDQLSATFGVSRDQCLNMYGMTELSANHISTRVPGEDKTFLINPYGLLFEEITASSLVEVMHECQAMVEPQAQKRGISVVFPQLDIPYFVNADRTRVKQVLINLLSNAVKFTDAGGQVEASDRAGEVPQDIGGGPPVGGDVERPVEALAPVPPPLSEGLGASSPRLLPGSANRRAKMVDSSRLRPAGCRRVRWTHRGRWSDPCRTGRRGRLPAAQADRWRRPTVHAQGGWRLND